MSANRRLLELVASTICVWIGCLLPVCEKVVLSSERKEVVVPPGVLARYVGTYQLGSILSIVITLEGGQLMAQATNQPKFPLFPESDAKFFLKVVDAQLEFLKNDKGDVTSLVLQQGGRDTKGIRK